MAEKHVYRFGFDANGNNVTEVAGDSVAEAKWITGGKGANLAEMANIGLPVPPGFTITCQTCVAYSSAGNVWPEGVLERASSTRSTSTARTSRSAWARSSATPRTRCSSPSAPALRSRCPA